jgi:hypothetical protein
MIFDNSSLHNIIDWQMHINKSLSNNFLNGATISHKLGHFWAEYF